MKIVLIGQNILAALALCCHAGEAARGEEDGAEPPSIAVGEELEEGWETLDPRQRYLFKRLAKVDALLNAVEERQFGNYRAQKRKEAESKAADRSIVRQYANGGGPVRWTKFYGRTIDAFYHAGPTRAVAAMDGWGNVAVGVAQGPPKLKQRPPQFDKIEEAQRKIQADAAREIESLGKKMDLLESRRKELEIEQLKLWCEIAFREVKRRDLTQKPFYRFEPKTEAESPDADEHVEAMRVAVVLMSRVLAVVERSEEDQTQALRRISAMVKGVRVQMTDTWIRKGVLEVSVENVRPDVNTPKGRLITYTRLLESYGANVDDCYARALKNAESRAEVSKLDEKKQNWDQLIISLPAFAAVVLAMDEAAIELAKEWGVQPDLDSPLALDEAIAKKTEAPRSPAPAVERPAFDVSKLRMIKIHKQGKKNKKKSPGTHAVTHKGGVAYVSRFDGSTTPLTVQDYSLSWQNPKGRPMKIDVNRMRSDDGLAVELIFDD